MNLLFRLSSASDSDIMVMVCGVMTAAKEENEVTRSREESHYDIVVALKNTSHIG